MRTYVFSTIAVALAAVMGCGSGGGTSTPAPAAGQQPQGGPTKNEIARLDVQGHTVIFFDSEATGVGVAEVGHNGSARILTDALVATKRPSEIYASLASPGAAVPEALLEAESRPRAPIAPSTTPPGAPRGAKGAKGTGPTYYDTGEQEWFASAFCESGYECVQGWDYAYSSAGYVEGRGFITFALNGDEASCSRTAEEDYWNGSSWQYSFSFSLSPGDWGWAYINNIYAPTISDNALYFKSELFDCGGTATQVSLSDYTFPWEQVCEQHQTCGRDGCNTATWCDYCPLDTNGGCTGYGQNCFCPQSSGC